MHNVKRAFFQAASYRTESLWHAGRVMACAMLVGIFAGCAAPLHAAQHAAHESSQEAPDAVFELWEQHWTRNADGSQVYREKRHLKLNSDRLYRVFGDPRITFNADTDEVEVLQARTRLPSGQYVELPDYSTVEVAPDDAGGLPAFANLRQRVMVMPGIQPGCVLETDYKITTKAGVRPYLCADLCIDQHYPVRHRTVTVTLPPGQELSSIVSGLPESDYKYSFEQRSDGGVTHRWDFVELDARADEPQAIPWQESGVRLAFTTATDANTWIKQRIAAIDEAADESELISKLAQEWTKDQNTESDKLRALQNKLADSFRFVDFEPAWRPAQPRTASAVISHNYGLPSESAGVLLALARAAGLAARAGLVVADGVWNDQAPQAALVEAYVVVLDTADGPEVWHPRYGRIHRDKRWAGHTLLTLHDDRVVRKTIPAWLRADESLCHVTGEISVAEDGTYAGQLTIRTSGLFVSPNELQTRAGQKSRAKEIVNRLLPSATAGEFTVKSLAPERFELEVQIASSDPLEQVHDCHHLELGETSPALSDVHIPITYSRRQTPIRLAGAFEESIKLQIAWPESWTASSVPAAVAESSGSWGMACQTVSASENEVQLTRVIRIDQRDLGPDDLPALRKVLNELRSNHARTLILLP